MSNFKHCNKVKQDTFLHLVNISSQMSGIVPLIAAIPGVIERLGAQILSLATDCSANGLSDEFTCTCIGASAFFRTPG